MSWLDEQLKSRVNDIVLKPEVMGVGASPRRGGNSDIVLKQILKGAVENGTPAESVQLRSVQYWGCVGCERCRKDKICTGLKDGMSLLYPDILGSRGLVLVSPTHNYNVTAWMKAFIDRLYCFYIFDDNRPRGWSSRLAGQGRKAVIAAICEQENKADMGFTLDAMRLPLEALGYEIVDELAVFSIFDRAGIKAHEEVLAKARDMGSALSKAF